MGSGLADQPEAGAEALLSLRPVGPGRVPGHPRPPPFTASANHKQSGKTGTVCFEYSENPASE